MTKVYMVGDTFTIIGCLQVAASYKYFSQDLMDNVDSVDRD